MSDGEDVHNDEILSHARNCLVHSHVHMYIYIHTYIHTQTYIYTKLYAYSIQMIKNNIHLSA